VLSLLVVHLIAALAAPLLLRLSRRGAPWLLGAVPMVTAGSLLLRWVRGEFQVLEARWEWLPQLGVELALRADGLSLLMVGLIGLVGGLVVLHAGLYLAKSSHLGRFYFLIFVFLAAMFGLVLADNLWLLFICWELTSIASFFLIGFQHEKGYARDAAAWPCSAASPCWRPWAGSWEGASNRPRRFPCCSSRVRPCSRIRSTCGRWG